jgi:hypothetical protein
LGNAWLLEVYPGGNVYADEGMVSVFLVNLSEKSIHVEFGFSVKDCVDIEEETRNFEPRNGHHGWGDADYVLRSKLMDSLVVWALVIEVHLNLKLIDPTKTSTPFIPEKPNLQHNSRHVHE